MKRLGFIVCLFCCTFVFATPLKNIVIFGDSLSDNGNLYEHMNHQIPVSPPYYKGRFSNGPVWVENLAAAYFPLDVDTHLLDYAFGGAGVSEDEEDSALFTLKMEIDSYLLAHKDKAEEDSLFIVWIGANNYLAMPDNEDKAVDKVRQGILHGLEKLANKGARHILVVNLPDLGLTPMAIEMGEEEKLSRLAEKHNLQLSAVMAEAQARYPQVQWLFFEVNKTFDDLIKHPDEYGFTNTQGTCYELALAKPSQQSILTMAASAKPALLIDACEGYLFFDPVHPAARAHQLMAEKAKVYLDEAGVEF